VGKVGAILGAVLLGALALALIIGGVIALVSEQALRTVDSAAEGRIPETLANEKRKSFRGDVQAIAVSGKSKSVGEFEAVEGTTEVACRFVERDNELASQRFAVSKIHEGWRTGSLVAVGLGVVVLLLAFWVGFRGMLRGPKGGGRFGGTSRPA